MRRWVVFDDSLLMYSEQILDMQLRLDDEKVGSLVILFLYTLNRIIELQQWLNEVRQPDSHFDSLLIYS